MSHRLIPVWLVCCLLLCGCATAVGADVMEPESGSPVLEESTAGRDWSGGVDWAAGRIEVTARGSAVVEGRGGLARAEIMALKAARYLGYAKLLELLQGVRLDASRSVGWLVQHRPRLRGRVQGLVRGAQVVWERTRRLSDGSVVGEVCLRLDLRGLERQSARVYLRPGKEGVGSPGGEGKVFAPSEEEYRPYRPRTERYTGLIVVATGLGARPAMFPQVVDENQGKVIFGPEVIDRKFAIERGVVGYATSVEKALLQKRVGSHPLIVKAVRAEGLNRARLVVPHQEALRIFAADLKGDFLRRCGVVIVLD